MVFIAAIALIVLFVVLAWVISRRADRRLIRFDEMTGYAVHAKDGQIGNVHDVYYTDDTWDVRYLVVDTSVWIFGKKVLVAPYAVRRVDNQQQKLFLDLTKEQVEGSPELVPELPLSREHEAEYNQFYRWPFYWSVGTMNFHVAPKIEDASGATVPLEESPPTPRVHDPVEPSLRSLKDLTGYQLRAHGGDVGKVDDVLVDGTAWKIAYFVVDTNAFLPGGKTLVSPDWIERIDWDGESVQADIQRDAVETAPEFDPNSRLTKTYEGKLIRHHGKNGHISRTYLPGGRKTL